MDLEAKIGGRGRGICTSSHLFFSIPSRQESLHYLCMDAMRFSVSCTLNPEFICSAINHLASLG